MKSIITKLVIFVLSSVLLTISLINSHSEENNSSKTNTYPIQDTQFVVGTFDNGHGTLGFLKDSLHFNTWHQYVDIDRGWNRETYDNYLAPTSQYSSLVNGILQSNKQASFRTLLDRPTMQYIIGGQRCDYQCEQVQSSDPYWFYAYNHSYVNDTYGISDVIDTGRYGMYENGTRAKVKYCQKNSGNQNKVLMIDSGLIAYRELAFNGGNYWTNDNYWKWYLMPRIRVDSSYAAGLAHNNDTICKISLVGWDKKIYKDVYLTVLNFKASSISEYSGNYLDTFYYYNNQENLEIPKTALSNFTPTNISIGSWNIPYYNDFKIYWYGKCDMWIDRVRLENDPAHKYLTLNNVDLHQKVDTEVGWAISQSNTNPNIPNYFYFEECEFSHFPIISALNKQIRDYSQNKSALMIWLNYDLFNLHRPDCWSVFLSAKQLKKYLYDDFGLNTIVMGSYAFQGWPTDGHPEWGEIPSYHPNTLPISLNYRKEDGVLSTPASPAFYDDWLQTHLDIGSGGSKLIYIYKLMDSLSKTTDMRVINCPQEHLWYLSSHKLKEPTNEEIELQTCLGITYNAKGTMYFSYFSNGSFDSNSYYRCLIDPDGVTPRHKSVYGQDKFKKVGDLSAKLNKWGPYIMSFEPTLTNNCIYRNSDERFNFLSNTYFHDIVTYKPGNLPPDCKEGNPGENNPPNLVYECNEQRYLQAATFKSNTSDVDKYFMIVNRRCSPYKDSTSEDNRGGKRYIRVRFDVNSPEFANFNNWEIFCIDSNKIVATFDKRAGTLIDLGWFMPGQGELYKISPVI